MYTPADIRLLRAIRRDHGFRRPHADPQPRHPRAVGHVAQRPQQCPDVVAALAAAREPELARHYSLRNAIHGCSPRRVERAITEERN